MLAHAVSHLKPTLRWLSRGGTRNLCTDPNGLMHLWTTPVLAKKPVDEGNAFLEYLTARGMTAYQEFEEEMASDLATSRLPDGLNSAFYQWQQDQHDSVEPAEPYIELTSSPELKHLKLLIADAVDEYIAAAGLDMGSADDLDIFVWAAILRSGESHLAHTHPSSLISGVFWSHVPEGAGPMLLDDPRGPLPPFIHRVPIEPCAGELVVFPSWLQHQVVPRQFQGARVAWSFNVMDPHAPQQSATSWQVTSGVHLATS